jgi:hypothetical protein
MQEFLGQVYQHLGPDVEKAVSTQFKLSPDQAKKVLPELAPTVANELKKKLEAPATNPELLAGFKNLLGATNRSQPALMDMAGPDRLARVGRRGLDCRVRDGQPGRTSRR